MWVACWGFCSHELSIEGNHNGGEKIDKLGFDMNYENLRPRIKNEMLLLLFLLYYYCGIIDNNSFFLQENALKDQEIRSCRNWLTRKRAKRIIWQKLSKMIIPPKIHPS